jgi:hypothetical protein
VAITNGYATLADVKNSLKITDNMDDSLLEIAVESASRLIDGYTGRYFYNGGTATRNYAASDSWMCFIDDLQSLSELATTDEIGNSYTTWTANDYQLEPLNGLSGGMTQPYTSIRAVKQYVFPFLADRALVKVTGVWGWASVPMAVKQATILQAARIFKRNDSPLGVAGFGDMGVVRVGARLDPDVQHLVDPYRSMRNFA